MLNNDNLIPEKNIPEIEEVRETESEGQIEILKKYHLRCLKCNQIAKFDNEGLLDEFLKERVKQKLIYSVYKEKFTQFRSEYHSERALEGHKRELCEKCQLLGRYCGEELIQQGQVIQVDYIPPFTK